MKHFKTYFVTGLVVLIPIFLIYQVIKILTAVAAIMLPALPAIVLFVLGIVLIFILGWAMVHIFKNRLHKHLLKTSRKSGVLGVIAAMMLEFDKISDNAHKAFKRPVLCKMDDGIYKLGYITKDDNFSLIPEELDDSKHMWVYIPNPVNFFGELVLINKDKVHPLPTNKRYNLPLFILSSGVITSIFAVEENNK